MSLVFRVFNSMMSKKMKFDGSKDLLSDLPEVLIGHILSFIPTKEAASTSVLAKKWRYLFALTYNLDFNDSVYVNPPEVEMVSRSVEGFSERVLVLFPKRNNVSPRFKDFVDRVLALQGNCCVHKFSLKIRDFDDPVDTMRIFGWILNVLERGVSDLDLSLTLKSECLLPSEIFLSETLVRLKLHSGHGPKIGVQIFHLPKLKSLCIDAVYFDTDGVGLAKLLSGCHVLEDLILDDMHWYLWDFASVSVPTLKRLMSRWEERGGNPEGLSFDTPNLVYLDFSAPVAVKYPNVNFGKLVEAKIDLRMSVNLLALEILHVENYNMVGNATDFIVGICNVKVLSISADTLMVLTLCCEAIPIFSNLTHLTIESKPKIGWESLPDLLKNSPNLETLVLQGLAHKATDRCGVVCVCQPYEDEGEISTCLSLSPVKVLKITKFGEMSNNMNHSIEKQIEQVKHFLETMPNLEQLILYYDTSAVEDVIEVSSQLQAVANVASSKCIVQLISDNVNVPSSVTMTLP